MEQVRLVWLCIYDNIVGVNVHFSLLVCYICAPVNILPQGGDFEQERWPRSGVFDHNLNTVWGFWFIWQDICMIGAKMFMHKSGDFNSYIYLLPKGGDFDTNFEKKNIHPCSLPGAKYWQAQTNKTGFNLK